MWPVNPSCGPPTRAARRTGASLLQFDDRALLLQLLLDLFGLRLRNAFLDGARRLVHRVLGLLEAEAGDLPDDLDDLDLLGAALLEDDGPLGLLFDRGGRGAGPRPARRRPGGHRRGDGDVELGLERLDQLRELDDGLVTDRLEDLFVAQRGGGHGVVSLRPVLKQRYAANEAPRGRLQLDTRARSSRRRTVPAGPAGRRPAGRAAARARAAPRAA